MAERAHVHREDIAAVGGTLTARLLAAVRPEFRADRLVADPDDPMLGAGGRCAVGGCGRGRRHRRLCQAHYVRWRRSGAGDLDAFVVTADPMTKGHRVHQACALGGCRRGRSMHGLCSAHAKAWQRSGVADMAAWLASQPPVTQPDDAPTCDIPTCTLLAEPAKAGADRPMLCRSHLTRWQRTGRPSLSEYIQRCVTYGEPWVDFSALPPQLRLELQYGVQCRVDARTTRLPLGCLNRLVCHLAETAATSLVADRDQVVARAVQRFGRRSTQAAFVRYTLDRLEDLLAGVGWEGEYARDRWSLQRLGYDKGACGAATLRFDRIHPGWLRELAKRHTRQRLTMGRSPSSVAQDVLALARLSQVLVAAAGQDAPIDALDRGLLERYLAWLATQGRSASFQHRHTAAVATFLTAVRRHGWDPGLPADAVLYADDYPRKPAAASRALSEHVMRQVEDPANLERFADPAVRLVTLILVRAGLRGGDARKLWIDCLTRDAAGAPYLRYRNHKLGREALVPIDDDLAALITSQQQQLRQRWPEGRVRLVPAGRNNPDGTLAMGRTHYVNQLRAWVQACDIRDDTGALAQLTPHQFRHTYGTRLINSGVPEEVVRRLLDHDSPDMTAHYARLQLTTIRQAWEQARKVNIAGEPVTLDPDGPLADAAWMKENLGRAKQTLPNGYCGLPLQQTCPHANACLTCPVFVTTAEFLPQHLEQRANTRTLIAAAKASGQARMVEMNQQVLGNLERIITALQAPEDEPSTRERAGDAG
jgi:integrase